MDTLNKLPEIDKPITHRLIGMGTLFPRDTKDPFLKSYAILAIDNKTGQEGIAMYATDTGAHIPMMFLFKDEWVEQGIEELIKAIAAQAKDYTFQVVEYSTRRLLKTY